MRVGLSALLAALLVTPHGLEAQAPKGTAFALYHVAASKGKEPQLPKELKKFASQIKMVGNRFRLIPPTPKKPAKPILIKLQVGKPHSLKLPEKLGTGQLVLDSKGMVTVILVPVRPKDAKDRLVSKYGRFPVFLVDPQKIKTPSEHYIFILEKLPPPKKK